MQLFSFEMIHFSLLEAKTKGHSIKFSFENGKLNNIKLLVYQEEEYF